MRLPDKKYTKFENKKFYQHIAHGTVVIVKNARQQKFKNTLPICSLDVGVTRNGPTIIDWIKLLYLSKVKPDVRTFLLPKAAVIGIRRAFFLDHFIKIDTDYDKSLRITESSLILISFL